MVNISGFTGHILLHLLQTFSCVSGVQRHIQIIHKHIRNGQAPIKPYSQKQAVDWIRPLGHSLHDLYYDQIRKKDRSWRQGKRRKTLGNRAKYTYSKKEIFKKTRKKLCHRMIYSRDDFRCVCIHAHGTYTENSNRKRDRQKYTNANI